MTNDGGLAFPSQRMEEMVNGEGKVEYNLVTYPGLTIRDYIAAQLAPALAKNWPNQSGEAIAKMAYSYSDAFLLERTRK